MAPKLEILTVSQIRTGIFELKKVFDIVRAVDPTHSVVYTFAENDEILTDEYVCYRVWSKLARCENCISMKARYERRRMTKYEFVRDEVYHVVSKPFLLKAPNGETLELSLEVVSNITDEILFEAFGKEDFVARINAANKKIYEDSLTGVYNRRYFDERVFCHSNTADLGSRVTFIMMDLKNFKYVNDHYGHDTGDRVLVNVGRVLKESVRSSDAVVRMGGDEFLIILNNVASGLLEDKIRNLKNKIKSIIYDEEQRLGAVANFGYAHTESFTDDSGFIENLRSEADAAMCQDKQVG